MNNSLLAMSEEDLDEDDELGRDQQSRGCRLQTWRSELRVGEKRCISLTVSIGRTAVGFPVVLGIARVGGEVLAICG